VPRLLTSHTIADPPIQSQTAHRGRGGACVCVAEMRRDIPALSPRIVRLSVVSVLSGGLCLDAWSLRMALVTAPSTALATQDCLWSLLTPQNAPRAHVVAWRGSYDAGSAIFCRRMCRVRAQRTEIGISRHAPCRASSSLPTHDRLHDQLLLQTRVGDLRTRRVRRAL